MLFVLVLYGVRQPERWGVPVEERLGLVRATTAVFAATIGASAALWLNHLAAEADSTRIAYLLTGAVAAGALTYLVGALLGYAGVALRLRWIGWVVMTLALVVPSTFSLALPIAAGLAVTLRPLAPRPKHDQPSPDVIVPR